MAPKLRKLKGSEPKLKSDALAQIFNEAPDSPTDFRSDIFHHESYTFMPAWLGDGDGGPQVETKPKSGTTPLMEVEEFDKLKAEMVAKRVQGVAREQNSEIKQEPLPQVVRDTAVHSTNIWYEWKESPISLKGKASLKRRAEPERKHASLERRISELAGIIFNNRELVDVSQAAKGAKCESGTYSAEDLIMEVEDRREDGYFLSSEWLLSLEQNQKYSLMSILSRAGYSETYRTGSTTLFERIENDVQNRIDANNPSSMGTRSDICTKDLQEVEVRQGGDAVEGLNYRICNWPGIATYHDLQYLPETSGDLRIAGPTMKVEDCHNTTNSLAASAPGKDELANMPPVGKVKGRLPPEITAEALFKYVQLPGFEDGENEFAYQATIKIGGSVFKGVLCDQGMDNGGSGVQQRNVADLQLRGGRTSSSSSLIDPSNLYGNPPGSALLGVKGRPPPEIRARALFKCVQLPGVENGGSEFAYQASVNIQGHVFKGVLYDQGMDNEGPSDNEGSSVQRRNFADLQLAGRSRPSSSALSDPSNLYVNEVSRCQVEDCEQRLCGSKDYLRRHKVCELHSKASKAMVAGLDQRFCLVCSRFHPLLEFDERKRSCRRLELLEGYRKRRLEGYRKRLQRPESAAVLSSRTFVPSGGSPASSANVHEKFTTSNSDHSLEEEVLTTLETFLSALKSSHQDSYAVSTGWLSCLEEHEKKELETIISEAGYTKIHQESNMTTFEKIRDDVGLPPSISCNNPKSTSDKTEVGASDPGKQELSRSCGLLRNDKLKGKLDEDTTTDPFGVASAVEKGQTQGEDSRCQPQILKVACTSLSETSTIPATFSSRGPNLRHFRRQQVGDCFVTMPRKGESLTISTAMERPFSMTTVEVPKDESTCREVCATLKATATTTTSCCLKINHTSKKIRVKFSKISGEVRNEKATGQRCNALALSSLRTNVYACLNKVETEDESEEVILNLENGRRALDDDLSWLEVSGRNPINCEPGSITLELQGNVRRRCKADLAAEVQRAHILHFQDAHPVVLEGELPVALNSRQFLELNVRCQLEVSYIKPCTPIPKGAKFVPGRRTSEIIDFDCCLDFMTKEIVI